jgi:signal transduction histidine kinase
MKLTKQLEAEVLDVYEAYWGGLLNVDMETYAAVLDNDFKLIGTTEAEVFFKKMEAVRFLKATADQVAGNIELQNRIIKIEPVDKLILITEQSDAYVNIDNAWTFYAKTRTSSLLQKKDGGWKFIQMHISFPDSKSEEGESIGLEKISKENLELREAVKRRTVELESKNRELEIETALEKVRAIAMGMKEPADMLEVCKIISLQLQPLGVKEIRNVQTAIFYESRGTYMNYEYYTKHKKTIITETVYTNHKVAKAFASQMLKGKGEIYSTHIRGQKVKDWIAYQKSTNVFIDRFLEKTNSLSYYWHSLGAVALGISTYAPLGKEELGLFKRFLGVFELAYTRYLDIEQALALAKEAKIEASLEKVRAQALGMRKPEDLPNVCEVLFKELQLLGFRELRNTMVNIHNDEKRTFVNYDYSDEIGKSFTPLYYDIHPIIKKQIKQIRRADDAFSETVFKGKDLESWKAFRKSRGEKEDKRIKNSTALYYYFYSLGTGSIGISTFNQITSENRELLKRFRNVFAFAYRRYMDVAQAEAQAKEAQIELGLERVRARAMAMQKSDELSELVDTVFKELTKLDFALNWCIINIIDAPSLTNMVWAANPETNKPPESYLMKFEDYPFHHSMMKGYQERKTKHVYVLEGKEKKTYDDYLFNKTEWRRVPKAAQDASRAMKRYVATFTFSNFGGLQTVGEEYLSEENLDILSRFGKVFDLTYTRFNDLQKAEAQIREAKIEAALERVRSRSMAMHKSEELKEVIKIVYQQLRHLKINLDHAGFVVDYKPGGDWHFWIADEQNIPSKITHPYFDSVWANQFNAAKEKGEGFFATHLNFEEKNKFYTELLSYVPGLPEASKNFYLTCPALAATTVLLDNIGLYIENFSGMPYTDEENTTLMRFGKVFQQTYTRFLDLQKAEAQAREAQIEAALERVRSRSMAMHKSEELLEASEILFVEMQKLGVESLTAGYVLMDKEEKNGLNYTPDPFTKKILTLPIIIPHNETVEMRQIVEHWKKGNAYYTVEMNEEETINHQTFIAERSTNFTLTAAQLIAISPAKLFLHNFYFKEGYVLIVGGTKLSAEQTDIMLRFTKVFQQTYTRFLDLQKAEAQARESQIQLALERVRARTMAMQHSNELPEAATILFQQMQTLGMPAWSAGYCIWDDDKKNTVTLWMSSEGVMQPSFTAPTTKDELFIEMRKGQKDGKTFHVVEMGGDKLVKHYKYMRTLPVVGEILDSIVNAGHPLPTFQIMHHAYFSKGFLLFITYEPVLAAHDIFKRFGKVFDQTYTRFLDLQKAEAQAREAQIETALEKVRSRTMAMQRSDELSGTAALLFQEFKKLEQQDLIQTTIGIYNEAKNEIEFRATDWEGRGEQISRPAYGSMDEPTLLHPAVAAWKANAKSIVIELTGESLQRWTNYRNKMTDTTILNQFDGGRRVISIAFFSKGHLSMSSPLPLPVETVKTLERFAAVFDGTYTRFLDLQKAEVQAREAQIEAALERVRSRTLAMQKSDELAETAAEVFRQLISLGIEPNRLYIGIVKEETGDMEMWATDEDGTHVGKKFMFNKNENVSVKKLFDGWKAKEKSVIVDMRGKELKDYFHYLNNVMHIPFKGGLTQKRRVQSVAYFSKGFIGMASPDGQGDETIQLLERFAAVFNLTFTRFNDLKIAEAHAAQAEHDLIAIKEAKQKAEEALIVLQATQKQLIQSEKMASLGELTAGIAHEIQNPLNFVNNFSEVSKELLDEIKVEMEKGNLEDAKEIMNDVIQNLEKINHHGKRADGIVKGMLQHSRSSSHMKEPTDINALADEYLRLAYHGLRAKDKSFNATLKTDYDENVGKVSVVPQDMGRVVLNLITNAFYVVNEKKASASSAGQPYEPTVSVSTKKEGTNILISVKDNGNGIPQKVVDKIFQPFFTTKPTGQGTGLGLSLSYDIIKAHGGEIKVVTKEGEGSEFIIQLPFKSI